LALCEIGDVPPVDRDAVALGESLGARVVAGVIGGHAIARVLQSDRNRLADAPRPACYDRYPRHLMLPGLWGAKLAKTGPWREGCVGYAAPLLPSTSAPAFRAHCIILIFVFTESPPPSPRFGAPGNGVVVGRAHATISRVVVFTESSTPLPLFPEHRTLRFAGRANCRGETGAPARAPRRR